MLAVIFINISGGSLSSNLCKMPDLKSSVKGLYIFSEIWNSKGVTQESQWQNIDTKKMSFNHVNIEMCTNSVSYL